MGAKTGGKGGDPLFSDDNPESKRKETDQQTQHQIVEPGLTGGPAPSRSPVSVCLNDAYETLNCTKQLAGEGNQPNLAEQTDIEHVGSSSSLVMCSLPSRFTAFSYFL